jgi:hypothetical protein
MGDEIDLYIFLVLHWKGIISAYMPNGLYKFGETLFSYKSTGPAL